jgi:type IV pilus assembly protein PilM
MNVPLLYKDKPLMGIDIGHSSVKAVQMDRDPKSGKLYVLGYGFNTFPEQAIKQGAITEPREIAKATYTLLTEMIVGGVNTNRVAAAIPVAKTFTRILTLPQMDRDDLDAAVKLEVEQYVPMQLEELYIDYEITHRFKDVKGNPQLEVLMVAAPKNIVESYLDLFQMLDLELGLLETSLISSVRGVNMTQVQPITEIKPTKSKTKKKNKQNPHKDGLKTVKPQNDENKGTGATLLVDFGAKSSDLSIFDNTIRVTGTIQKGGDTMTTAIASKLKLTERQAYTIKTRFGLEESKQQKDIETALKPTMNELIKEIQKMQRYYKSRAAGTGEITRLIMLGGGANLPGISTYLEQQTKLTTSICNPWQNVEFGQLQEPHKLETTMYTTSVGLSLAGLESKA